MINHRETFILSLIWESVQPLQEACQQCQKPVRLFVFISARRNSQNKH